MGRSRIAQHTLLAIGRRIGSRFIQGIAWRHCLLQGFRQNRAKCVADNGGMSSGVVGLLQEASDEPVDAFHGREEENRDPQMKQRLANAISRSVTISPPSDLS